MKKGIFAAIFLALLASCSNKTNEEKARDLIEPQVKANLIKPESYEFAQIQIDSCFSDDADRNPDAIIFAMKVAKLYKEFKKYKENAEEAESSMTIYDSSYGYQSAHSKQQHQKYKSEMELAQRKADTTKEKILQLYKDNKQLFENIKSGKHEFTGWAVTFGYRAETAGGLKTMGAGLYILNKELSEIIYTFSEEDMADIQSAELEDLKYDFEEELNEIFEKE